MVMRFKRTWDFDPGNKSLAMNDLTQDREVILSLREALEMAAAQGIADQTVFDPDQTVGLGATDVQAAIVELEQAVIDRIQAAVDDLLQGAPGALDTLMELATALGNDANFATNVTNTLATKLDAEQVMDMLGNGGIAQGTNITLAYDDATGVLTISGPAEAAASTTFTPAGTLEATDVQAAIEELDARASQIEGDIPSIPPDETLLLEAGEGAANVPGGTPVGTLVFVKV